MAAILEQRTTRAAGWSRRFGVFSAVLSITAGLAHRYAFLETPPFLWVLAIVGALALGAVLLGAYAFSRLWNHDDLGGRDLSVGIVVGALVLTPFLLMAYRGVTSPVLYDISTDLDDPPALAHALQARRPDMNPINAITPAEAKLQADAYPTVTGRRFDLSFDRTLDAVSAVLKRQGWLVYPSDPVSSAQVDVMIEAEAYTLIFALPVDVSIRVTDEATSSYVDMRSTSRYGPTDFGDNAARISAFLAELDTEIAGQAGPVPAQ